MRKHWFEPLHSKSECAWKMKIEIETGEKQQSVECQEVWKHRNKEIVLRRPAISKYLQLFINMRAIPSNWQQELQYLTF